MGLVIPKGLTIYRGGGKLRGDVPDAIAKQLPKKVIEAIKAPTPKAAGTSTTASTK